MSIKELRLKKGWSQEQLAELSNLSTRTIQRIEKENKASLESLKSLAITFNIEINELKERLVSINNINENENIEIEEESFITFLMKEKSVIKFLAINLMLFFINIFTSTEHLWFIYPLLGWGFILFYKKYIKYSQL